MYKIEKKTFGYKLVFDGMMDAAEMAEWVDASEKALTGAVGKFGVCVDMRGLAPLLADAQEHMQRGQKLYKQKGMERSAVILDSDVIALQFKRIAKETGIYEWERYIAASKEPNWEKVAVDWITKAIDPDKKVPAAKA